MAAVNLAASLVDLPRRIDAIVVHPDTIEDTMPYAQVGDRLGLENMDARKPVARRADELARFFDELPAAGFCFDVAHAWSIDPSMGEAHRLLDRFADRLRHVHLFETPLVRVVRDYGIF